MTGLLVAVACYFFLTAVFQSLVSIRGNGLHLGGVSLGLAVAFASGAVGTLTDIPFAILADARGSPRMVRLGLGLSIGASVVLLGRGTATLFIGALTFGVASSAMGAALLGWLTVATPSHDQARVQGMNVSLQRGGALVASGTVGLALVFKQASLLAIAAALVTVVALCALAGPARSLTSSQRQAPPSSFNRMAKAAATSFALLRSHRIRMAAITSVAINIVFLSTNAYLPLVRGHNAAIIVTLSLVARDVVAIGVGLTLAVRPVNLAQTRLVVAALAGTGVCTWLSGELLGTAWPILFSGLDGAVIALFIVATNLFTIGGSSTDNRTVGMAVGLWPTRLVLLVLPVVGSVILRTYGLTSVFRLMAVILGVLGALSAVTGWHHHD